jgi:O-antigen ligase
MESEKNDEFKIYKIWSIILLIIILDLIFEFFNGKNILGFTSVMPGARLASFTGNEGAIGGFFYGFVLFFLSYLNIKFNNKYLTFFVALFLIILSFLIGERSNFIKIFLSITIFLTVLNQVKFKELTAALILIVFSLILFLNLNKDYKLRYFEQVKILFQKKGISEYLDNSLYGAHYNVAKEIFKDNPIFGVGIKNFRIESHSNKKYENLDHPYNAKRGSTHPHQIHYEFLSETGLFGYFSFLIFLGFSLFFSIKNYLIEKNIFQLSGILFVLTSIIPLLPSGSFFSTYNSSFFWINYAVMMGYINYKKFNF